MDRITRPFMNDQQPHLPYKTGLDVAQSHCCASVLVLVLNGLVSQVLSKTDGSTKMFADLPGK